MGWQCHKMATSGAQSSFKDWRKSVTCRYYQYGLCKAGDACQYAHDKTSAPPVMCKFFMKGKCRYGDECRFDHKHPDQQAMPPVSPQPQQPQIIQIVPTQQHIMSAQPRPISQPLPPPPMPARMVPLQKAMMHGGPMVSGPVVSMPMPMGSMGGPLSVSPHMMAAVTSQMSQMGHMGHMSQIHMQDYVNAAAFVPGQPYQNPVARWIQHFHGGMEAVENEPHAGRPVPSYLSVAQMGVEPQHHHPQVNIAPSIPPPPIRKSPTPPQMQQSSPVPESKKPNSLCPFNVKGTCRYGANCIYLHGNACDLCGEYCLHPTDKKQNKEHRSQCMAEHEKNMQVAFAFQRSKDVACGICMEVILEKSSPKDRKFGLLSNCNHPYCLACIRKWRSAKQYEKKVVRGCPTCRVASHFVTPSDFWVDDPDEKKKIVEKYQRALSIKPCKYFDQGRGTCPFGADCFYLHAYQDGSKEDRTKVRKYNNADGKLRTFRALQLWDFFEERDNRLLDGSSDDDDDWFLYYDWSDEFDYYSDFEDELWSDYFDFYGARSDESDNGSGEPPSSWVISPLGRITRSRDTTEATPPQQPEEGDGNDGDDEGDGHAAADGEVIGDVAEETTVADQAGGNEENKMEDKEGGKKKANTDGNDVDEDEFEDCLSDEFNVDW